MSGVFAEPRPASSVDYEDDEFLDPLASDAMLRQSMDRLGHSFFGGGRSSYRAKRRRQRSGLGLDHDREAKRIRSDLVSP